jgi:hypothetical protein
LPCPICCWVSLLLGGTSRLYTKRQLVVQEANAIGTAYLHLDELPVDQQPGMRRLFRECLDARLIVYETPPDPQAVERELARATGLQKENLVPHGERKPQRPHPEFGPSVVARAQ